MTLNTVTQIDGAKPCATFVIRELEMVTSIQKRSFDGEWTQGMYHNRMEDGDMIHWIIGGHQDLVSIHKGNPTRLRRNERTPQQQDNKTKH